ncbi:MAG: ATP-dependent zinc metalloprotease FtsH [Actinobacteria bacterium 66_15]|nr:MAG: ATP-dependent zinc metalloprotease FtsH [Actinobacteria bacterium 66_15]
MNRNLRTALLYLFFIVLGLLFLANTLQPAGVTDELSYSEFTSALKAGRVVSAEVFARSQEIEGEYYPDDDALAQGEHKMFVTNYLDGAALTEDLKRYEPNEGYTVNMQDNQIWLSLLTSFVPIVIIVIVMFWLINQMQGGNSKVMSFGKSRAKRITRDQPRITFKDVAGVDEAVEELEEIKEFLSNPGKFQALGAKIPKGVLLVGPPGTGKTLLARAVAGEAGVPFFTISGSDFVEMFVGVGASRVRDLFEQAKAASPCIVFIDELDAVGRMRGAGLGGGHDEREQTLNQLLVEMDGFDIKDNVIIMAATNRPDVLDAALLRPGRFDRQIMVDRPDLKGRHEILKIHSRGKPLGDDIDLEVLARRTPGFTGADLANLVNEAALLAARHGKKAIDMVELEDAIERVIAGPERKSRIISDKEKRVIAYHESGHALVGHVLPNTDPIHKISIISRGRALGYTLALPVEDKFLSARGEMLDEIAMMLGGRVAEAIAIGDITTGASNDIERATKLARQMVTQYGMSEKLGPMTLGEGQHEVFLGRDFSATPNYSQEIAFEIDKEVRRLIDEAYETAYRILTERREQLDLMADVLVERETVDKDELEALLEGTWAAFLEQEKAKAAERPKQQKPKRGAKKQVEEQEPEVEAPSDDRPIVDVPPPLGDPGGA